jgi:hypothetical protein
VGVRARREARRGDEGTEGVGMRGELESYTLECYGEGVLLAQSDFSWFLEGR